MSISVKLFSEKPGELKDFLSTYYGRTQRIAEDLEQWIYVYRNPLDTVH